jgi:hypothetical protein
MPLMIFLSSLSQLALAPDSRFLMWSLMCDMEKDGASVVCGVFTCGWGGCCCDGLALADEDCLEPV